MEKEINFIEYRDEDFYFLYTLNKAQKGETHYNTHSHPRHEIMFISEGGIEYVVENRRHELKKGDVLLVKPGLLHFARRITSAPSSRYCIGFYPEALENKELIRDLFDAGEHFSLGEDSVFAHLSETLLYKLSKNQNSSREFAKNIMDAMILTLSEEALGEAHLPKATDSGLQKIIEYINAHLTEIKTMDDIADALFFSKSYLSHLFKKETNIGIMEYVRNKKVVRAHTIIESGEKPTEIFAECGFSNYPSFFRAYRAFYGFSPKTRK